MTDEDSLGYYKFFPTRTKEWVDTYVAPYAGLEADLTPAEKWDDSLIPDLSGSVRGTFTKTPSQQSMDEWIEEKFDLLTAIEQVGKWNDAGSEALFRKADGSLWARCPIPGHVDNDPSAHVTFNASKAGGKDVWHCFGCGIGGDAYNFWAHARGFNTRDPQSFIKMREDIAYVTGWIPPIDPSEDEDDSPKEEAPVEPAADVSDVPTHAEPPIGDVAPVISLFPDAGGSDKSILRIPWEEIVPSSTFIHEYVTRFGALDIANEFLFWQAVQMVGLAAGRDAWIASTPNIYPSIYLLLKSNTGSGKSRSIRIMQDVLHSALPYDPLKHDSRGVMMGGDAGSGEAIVGVYAREIPDVASPTGTFKPRGLRAFWTIDELSSLIARSSRGSGGSTLMQSLMTLHDAPSHMTHRLRSGDLVAEEPFGAVIAGTQPEVMRNFLTRADALSGFLNRWVHVEGVPKQRHAVQDLQVDASGPIAMLRALSAWCERKVQIELKHGGAGRARWEEFFHDEIEPLQSRGNPIFARMDLMMMKLMLVLAINQKQKAITSEIVDRAAKVYPYLVHTYTDTLSEVSLSNLDRVADAVEKALREGPQTRGRLRKFLADRGYVWADVSRVLMDLERSGQIEDTPYQNSKGGPKTKKLTWVAS